MDTAATQRKDTILNEPTHLDLFSGIGGFAVAAQWAGFRTIAFCEIDVYCQKVLAKSFLADAGRERVPVGREASNLAGAPREAKSATQERERVWNSARDGSPVIHRNIFDFDGTLYRGCDLLTGGFPCQPFSVAGKRRGAADDRHLWPEMLRVIKEARPAWVLGENVPGIIPMELDNVLSDLEGIGYATRPFVIPACAVDARHRRDRLWIVAHDISTRSQERNQSQLLGERSTAQRNGVDLANTEKFTERESTNEANAIAGEWNAREESGGGVRWLPEPDVGRVAHGIPKRVDRLKGLGNSIVPQVAFQIMLGIISEIEKSRMPEVSR